MSEYRALAQRLLRNAYELGNLMRVERADELVQGELGVMMCLTFGGGDDGMFAGELSTSLQLTTGRVATVLRRLEEKGLVERRGDSRDKRRVKVFITEQGREQALAQYEKSLCSAQRLLQTLGEEDADALVRITKKLAERLAEKRCERGESEATLERKKL